MYQYIKHIIHITLLVIIITSCDSSKSEVVKGPVTLADLESKLKDGPIFIGEDHVQPFARKTIIKLIQSGHVKALFLKLPYIKDDLTDYLGSSSRSTDQNKKKATYLMELGLMEIMPAQATDRKKNDTLLKNLIEAALDKKDIPIYFHDAPIDTSKDTMLINGKHETLEYGGTNEGIKGRNIDSAKIIKKHAPGPGTVVLAVQKHVDPKIVGKNHTLQALLGYGDDRTFYLHELTEALK